MLSLDEISQFMFPLTDSDMRRLEKIINRPILEWERELREAVSMYRLREGRESPQMRRLIGETARQGLKQIDGLLSWWTGTDVYLKDAVWKELYFVKEFKSDMPQALLVLGEFATHLRAIDKEYLSKGTPTKEARRELVIRVASLLRKHGRQLKNSETSDFAIVLRILFKRLNEPIANMRSAINDYFNPKMRKRPTTRKLPNVMERMRAEAAAQAASRSPKAFRKTNSR